MVTNMTPLEILSSARRLLSLETRWTKGWFGKTEDGRDRDALAPDAVCWCVAGGIERVSEGRPAAYFGALRSFVEANAIGLPVAREEDGDERDTLQDMHDAIGGFNDALTHAGMLAALDRAIELEANYASK